MQNTFKVLFSAAFLAVILIFIAVPCIVAQQPVQAVIKELAGTVEIKYAGSEIWEAASRGQTLAGDTTISTGFRSTAVITIGDSILTVRPLTRLTLTELTRNQDNEKVELNLQSGRVKADVKPPEGGKTEFVVKSPNSTSSVRGTVFEFDTINIEVYEGTVQFSGLLGSTYMLDAVGYSRVDELTSWASPPSKYAEGLRPEIPYESDPIKTPAQPPNTSSPTTTPNPGSQPSNPGSQPPYSPPSSTPGGDDGLVDFTPIVTF